MARRSRKTKPKFDLEAVPPTEAQLANGDFERDFVTHVDTNTKAMAFRNRRTSIVERWVKEGGPGFEPPAQRVIADCVRLWLCIGSPRLVANYGERIPSSTHGEGWSQQEALDTLHHYKSLLNPYMRHYWTVFENVIRHNEPAGVAGSQFATNDAQRIQSAKVITGMVATHIAGELGY